MQRDMELVRKIVAAVQAKNDLRPRKIEVEGYEAWIVARHVEMLHQQGMLDTTEPFYPVAGGPPAIHVRDLSPDGHDLAASLANDDIWSQIRTKFSAGELAMMPLKVVKDVGVAALQAWALSKMGLGGA